MSLAERNNDTNSIHNSEQLEIKCNKCDKNFTKEESRKRHIKELHEGFLISCNECEFKTPISSKLSSHKRQVHRGIRLPCGLWEHVFMEKTSLSKHMRSHHSVGERSISCSLCEFKAIRKITWKDIWR